MQLLLEQRGESVPITEEVVKAAVHNNRSGKEVIELLLERRGNDIQITEEVVEVVARNSKTGEEMMRLLLEREGTNSRSQEVWWPELQDHSVTG